MATKHITYQNGYYEGEVNFRGERHGYGVYQWNTGNRYEGEWRDDKREGRGIYTSEDGKTWEGIFHDRDGDPIKQTLPDGTVRYGVLKDFTFIPNGQE